MCRVCFLLFINNLVSVPSFERTEKIQNVDASLAMCATVDENLSVRLKNDVHEVSPTKLTYSLETYANILQIYFCNLRITHNLVIVIFQPVGGGITSCSPTNLTDSIETNTIICLTNGDYSTEFLL